jgi:hypothetical protein
VHIHIKVRRENIIHQILNKNVSLRSWHYQDQHMKTSSYL